MSPSLIDAAHVVGEWDADLRGWWARDWTPGPAGTAGLPLGGGVELDVDVASPSTLVGLWVPSPLGGRGKRRLRRLLGDGRADQLLALGAGGAPGGPVVLGPGRTRRFGPPRARSVGGDGVPAPLARLALATAPSITDAADPLVRALGHVDAAVAALEVGGGLGLGGRGQAHALAGLELLLDLARRGELEGRPVDGSALADGLGRLGPSLPDGRRAAARALGNDLASGAVAFATVPRADPGWAAGGAASPRAERAAFAIDAPAAAAAAPMSERLAVVAPKRARLGARAVGHVLAVDRGALPQTFLPERVVARTTTASEAELRVSGRAADGGRWWARAWDVDGAIVAAAPLLGVGDDAVARLLVPPERLSHVVVDVTDQPGAPRPSAAALGVLDAVAQGQAAARAERVGDTGVAAARWHRSAAAWTRVGADQRAGLARELAAGKRGGRVPEPLLSDRLLESIEGGD